jgi:hypothetical protein
MMVKVVVVVAVSELRVLGKWRAVPWLCALYHPDKSIDAAACLRVVA